MVVRCQDPMDGQFCPHPSLRMRIHPPTNLRVINFGPASRSLFSGLVKTKYSIGFWWKLTPPFQVPSTTFIHPSWSLFHHIPLSAVLQYIYSLDYSHSSTFSQGPFTLHIHIFFEFATILGQYSYFYRLGETGCYKT
jgi:hypothetical protein